MREKAVEIPAHTTVPRKNRYHWVVDNQEVILPGPAIPAHLRDKLLEKIVEGVPLATAAADLGINPLAISRLARKDPHFLQDLLDALELSTAPIEAILLEIASNPARSAMARVQAARTLLEGRSSRYKHLQPPDPSNNSSLPTRFSSYPQLDT